MFDEFLSNYYPCEMRIHDSWNFGRADCMKIDTCKHKFSSTSVYSSRVKILVIMYLPKITSLFAQCVILLYVPNVRNIGLFVFYYCEVFQVMWGVRVSILTIIHSKMLKTLVYIARKTSMYIKKKFLFYVKRKSQCICISISHGNSINKQLEA